MLLFLGPLFGFRFVYIGSNFWFHLIIPLIAVIEVILFNNQTFSKKDNLLGLIPLTLSVMLGKEPIKNPAKIQIKTNIKCSKANENKKIQGMTAAIIPKRIGNKTIKE